MRMMLTTTTATWGEVVATEVRAALDTLEQAIQTCPPERWKEPIWAVRRNDPYVWPVRRVGASIDGDEELLQTYAAFWNVAYHALFFLDADLSAADPASFAPPAPFVEEDHEAHRVPARPYTRGELQSYVDHVRDRTAAVLAVGDAALLVTVDDHRHGPQPLASAILGAVAHAHQHVAQLDLLLGRPPAEAVAR